LAAAVACPSIAEAGLRLATRGQTEYVILQQEGATAAEKKAANELADALGRMTGARFEVRPGGGVLPANAIVVGPGPEARRWFPEIDFAGLGDEEIVVVSKGDRLLIAGGRPRGTLYAAYWFLQEMCGVRWWTPWASTIPRRSTLRVPDLRHRYRPVFESRDPFWFPAFNKDWAARHFSNSQSAHLTEAEGGAVRYKGFVHTFYSLVPPEKHFAEHPEWFSLIKGKRTHDHAQLCLSNPQLRAFVVERVREWLRESPEASIVSVSQNDWHGACECPTCKACDDAQGGPAGSLLAFVNDVAAKIGPEFPNVAVDTLAYQYTRKAPATLRPLPNVIIRLCSIECNFAQPLEHASNRDFARDIRDWSRICQRLYIWDYTTDFAHYIQPHPNWYVLGPNVRFFRDHHVKGLFEQGAYQSNGAEMSELRAWVLSRLLWNPALDDRKLIREFLEGYYGPKPARHIRKYFNLMSAAARDYKLTCFSPTTAKFLNFTNLAQAENLWNRAEADARGNPDRVWRIRIARLALDYVWLSRWDDLQRQCRDAGQVWPLALRRKQLAESWLQRATSPGPAGWTPVTHLRESGLTPAAFTARFN
jgi:hypothetical protein